jgi:hypothetical protein
LIGFESKKISVLFHMQAALLPAIVLPPPPACPEILTGPDGAGAGGATNADESLIM